MNHEHQETLIINFRPQYNFYGTSFVENDIIESIFIYKDGRTDITSLLSCA